MIFTKEQKKEEEGGGLILRIGEGCNVEGTRKRGQAGVGILPKICEVKKGTQTMIRRTRGISVGEKPNTYFSDRGGLIRKI